MHLAERICSHCSDQKRFNEIYRLKFSPVASSLCFHRPKLEPGTINPVVHIFIHPAGMQAVDGIQLKAVHTIYNGPLLSGSKLSRICLTFSKPLNSEVSCSEIRSSFAWVQGWQG